MQEKETLKLLLELGVLSRTPRSGPFHVGIRDQETIASHNFRQMVLAYYLAKEEDADVNKVLKMSLVHEFPETKTLDHTFIQKPYFDEKKAALKAVSDQLGDLDEFRELKELYEEYKERKSFESKIVWDADLLEGLVEAREYIQKGDSIMERWFLDKREKLATETARKLYDILKEETLYWWK